MNFSESLVFYLVIGLAVAVAHARSMSQRRSGRWLEHSGTCLFWPLYLPLLLTGGDDRVPSATPGVAQRDELALAIEQVEQELDAALRGLDGWAEGVLNERGIRLDELRSALVHQADRIREMESLLAKEQASVATPSSLPQDASPLDRSQRSLLARQENMARLAGLCSQARCELMATLAWVRELVSMIHLAKFTGAPAARAEELVAQIAAAVEGIASASPGGLSQTVQPSLSRVPS